MVQVPSPSQSISIQFIILFYVLNYSPDVSIVVYMGIIMYTLIILLICLFINESKYNIVVILGPSEDVTKDSMNVRSVPLIK